MGNPILGNVRKFLALVPSSGDCFQMPVCRRARVKTLFYRPFRGD